MKDTIQTYEKLPVQIQAVQWIGRNINEVFKLTETPQIETDFLSSDLVIFTLKGVNGELYPCKPDIFEKTYKQVTK